MEDNAVPEKVVEFVGAVNNAIINPIIGVIFALALVYFLWGLMMFIFNAGDESKVTEGKQHMLYGVIGMTVMVSVFAIIGVVLATFDVGADDLPSGINL
ncbi:MAG: hypothetical protein KBD24_03365 [Candidatus Pacebacteria bacterium]|nr:hypothetical protein [Candidatus Paceibacterota bacterium]